MFSFRRFKRIRIAAAAVLAVCSLLTVRAAVTDGLVSYWPFEEISPEGTAVDSSSLNALTMVGSATTDVGQRGNALVLDGASYVTNLHDVYGGKNGLPIYRGRPYTVMFWVKGAAQTAHYLFAEGSSLTTDNPIFIIQTGQAAANNAKLDVVLRNDLGVTQLNHIVSAGVVFDDTWHHIAWVDDGGAVKLYIDGNLDTANFNYTPAPPYTFNTTSMSVLVRQALTATTSYFNGMVDELAIWERALTQQEVQSVRTDGLTVPGPAVPITVTSVPADVTRKNGDWAFFLAKQTGSRPVDYRWYKNDVLMPNETNQYLRVSGLTPANTGDKYSVGVSNSLGEVKSTNATLTVSADDAPDLRKELVNYWPLNAINQAGTELVSPDLYSGNDMWLHGFADTNDTIAGKFGQALDFNLVKYAQRTNGAPIYNATNYSVALWVKGIPAQGDKRVFAEGSTTDNDPLFTLGTDNRTALGVGGAGATVFVRNDTGGNTVTIGKKSTRPVFDTDNWHHLVWTDANGQGRLYVDGVLDETDFTYTRPTLTLNTTAIGAILRAAVGNQFLGSIDEVATWKRTLSATEIQQIYTTGIPAPISIIAPAIVVQPLSRTNNIFPGDTVSFNVQASGTQPLTYEWYRNGSLISVASNESAGTDTLVLTNLQSSDSPATFYVKVSNTANSATSDTVNLVVTPYTPATSGDALKIDVGLTTLPNPQPGFDEFNLGINGTRVKGVGVTISPLGSGTTLADRNRTAGAMVTNNPPVLTQAQIYNDFIFANSTADETGLRIVIDHLSPNTPFRVTIWSYDPQSNGARFADWAETSGATPVEIQTQYTFDGLVQPVADNDRTMTAMVASSAEGVLQIDGIKRGGANFGVFVNAIELVANPGFSITKAELAGANVRLTIEVPSANSTVNIEGRADVAAGAWAPVTPANTQQNGNILTIDVPMSGAMMFYRAVIPANP